MSQAGRRPGYSFYPVSAERILGRRPPLLQTMRFIGLAALVLSVAACGGGKHKHPPKTQKEVWQSQGFEAGLKTSATH
ncbi:hypothetical protein HLH27_12650 [Gluconacetobacter takamatsuzukensis]|uniref:Uncharacterized protein n=1 Tax=Gluconacetobacter takamatsuzukensis TaxID=1286190 RepID=A0A7W4KF79_9PROT|nr:hypothetical protein [Gluconacetobacter takamatsuzukensis]